MSQWLNYKGMIGIAQVFSPWEFLLFWVIRLIFMLVLHQKKKMNYGDPKGV